MRVGPDSKSAAGKAKGPWGRKERDIALVEEAALANMAPADGQTYTKNHNGTQGNTGKVSCALLQAAAGWTLLLHFGQMRLGLEVADSMLQSRLAS